jgi:Xaa-Pro dipeptidase
LNRIDKLRKAAFVESGGLDGYLIFNSVNQFYFLGFPGTSALLVPAYGECTVYVYGVNYEQAKAMGKDFCLEKVQAEENFWKKIAAKAVDSGLQRLAVDSLAVESWSSLARAFVHKAKLKADGSHVAQLRAVKDNEEIALMHKAGEFTSEGMRAAAEAVKVGAREYEVAAEIEFVMRKSGSGPTAFESIVASGTCSAFPHGGCSGREIRSGDLVVVDIGATCEHYCSDMTRTFVAGKPSQKQLKIYSVVKEAQQKAFEAIKREVPVADVDAAARRVISEAGFCEFFVHRVGHGVGLEVHEPPSMGATSKDKLAAGNVVTDEPGIYIPGYGGVRIEDTVLVTAKGPERLTMGPYSLNDT